MICAGFFLIGMEFGRDAVQMIPMDGQLINEESSRELALPSLLIQVPSRTIAGFDCVGRDEQNTDAVISIPEPAAPVPACDDAQIPYALSLSMPASPSGLHLSRFRTESVRRDEAPVETVPAAGKKLEVHSPRLLQQTRFHSQPMLHAPGQLLTEAPRRVDSARDKRFDPFKTFSGRLERQLSNLRGRPDLESLESKISEETDQVPGTDRYFDALEGPELDTLRVRSN